MTAPSPGADIKFAKPKIGNGPQPDVWARLLDPALDQSAANRASRLAA